jgi:hypothetical protein
MSNTDRHLPNDPDGEVGLRYLGEPGPGEGSEFIGEPVEPSRYQPDDTEPDPDAVTGEVEREEIYRDEQTVAEAGPSLTTGLDPVQGEDLGMDPAALEEID